MFSTHSPNLIFNFNSRQIRQVVLDEADCSVIRSHTDIGRILDDLGYGANDLMNVSFVFFVEGKQDKSRLPLLLKKYYSEITDLDGNLSRIAVITTNSCTNIKTYANLKYMNQLYIKDQFLMIRDGDGQDAEALLALAQAAQFGAGTMTEQDTDKMRKLYQVIKHTGKRKQSQKSVEKQSQE